MRVPAQSQCLSTTTSYSHKSALAWMSQFKAFIAVKDKPRLLFDVREEDGVVSGFVQGAPGEEFAVGLYFAGEKKDEVQRGHETEIFFGEQLCVLLFLLFSALTRRTSGSVFYDLEHKSQAPYDSPIGERKRFRIFEEYRIDDDHVRKLAFAPTPTADAEGACCEADFLDSVNTIKITFRRFKTYRVDHVASDKLKEAEKERKKSKQPKKKYDPLEKQDKRAVDETVVKGKFGLNASFGPPVVSRCGNDPGKPPTLHKYEFINSEGVDLTFILRIRSEAWVRKLLAGTLDEPDSDDDASQRSPSPPPTPPLELNNELYTDFEPDEAQLAADVDQQKARLAAEDGGAGKGKGKEPVVDAPSDYEDLSDLVDDDEEDEDDFSDEEPAAKRRKFRIESEDSATSSPSVSDRLAPFPPTGTSGSLGTIASAGSSAAIGRSSE
ncbi:hypothetical protein JCM10213_007678 [Rhodosporidiobolus nylandii]